MTITNFPNGISSFGVPLPTGGGLPATTGKYIFVDYTNGSDGNTGEDANTPVKTVAQAYSLARTNKDDVIVLIGSATHQLTGMLTVAKNRVHFVGLDAATRTYGQNAKIDLGVTAVAADVATIKVTGVRNSFHNIKFVNSNTVAQALYCVMEGGEYTSYTNCEFYKDTLLTTTAAAEILMNGDSTQFFGCTIGSSANAITGAIIRPNVALAKGTAGTGLVSRDVTFTNCQFLRNSGNTANAFVWSTSATDVERKMEFADCLFYSDKTSTALPAVAIGGTNALTAGYIVVRGNSMTVGCTKLATQTGVINGVLTYTAAGGIGIQST